MEGGSGSGCACCSCGCLVFFVAIIVAIVLIFAFFVPINQNYQYRIPDEFQEYYPVFNDGSGIRSGKRSVLLNYELSVPSAISYRSM